MPHATDRKLRRLLPFPVRSPKNICLEKFKKSSSRNGNRCRKATLFQPSLFRDISTMEWREGSNNCIGDAIQSTLIHRSYGSRFQSALCEQVELVDDCYVLYVFTLNKRVSIFHTLYFLEKVNESDEEFYIDFCLQISPQPRQTLHANSAARSIVQESLKAFMIWIRCLSPYTRTHVQPTELSVTKNSQVISINDGKLRIWVTPLLALADEKVLALLNVM